MAETFPVGTDLDIDSTLDDLTVEQLRTIMPRCDAPTWHPLLIEAMGLYGIVTRRRVCGFLSQVAHESGECRRLEESLSYTAERLLQVWPSRFKSLAEARPYEHQPQRLANRVYASRIGNGPEASGDGWRYRGGGLIMCTGLANYTSAAAGTGLPLVEHPELLRAPDRPAAIVSAWWWRQHGCNDLADACDPGASLEAVREPFVALTRRINGGTAGLDDRLEYWDRTRQTLAA